MDSYLGYWGDLTKFFQLGLLIRAFMALNWATFTANEDPISTFLQQHPQLFIYMHHLYIAILIRIKHQAFYGFIS